MTANRLLKIAVVSSPYPIDELSQSKSCSSLRGDDDARTVCDAGKSVRVQQLFLRENGSWRPFARGAWVAALAALLLTAVRVTPRGGA